MEGHDGLTAEQNKEIVDGYVRDRITARGHGAQWATWGHRVREGSKKSRVHFHIWTSVGPMLENGKLSDTETDWFFDEEQDAWEKAIDNGVARYRVGAGFRNIEQSIRAKRSFKIVPICKSFDPINRPVWNKPDVCAIDRRCKAEIFQLCNVRFRWVHLWPQSPDGP